MLLCFWNEHLYTWEIHFLYILYLYLSSVESASILLIVWSKSIAPTRLLLFAPKTAVSCLVQEICILEFSRLLTLREKYLSSKSNIRNWKKITANIFDQSWIIVRSIYFRISRRKSLVVVETNANFRRHQWLVNKTLCTYGVYILCLISQYYLV